MPVNFGLLETKPAVQPSFKPADALGNVQRAYTLAGDMVDVGEKVRSRNEAEQDRAILQDYMKSSGANFTSPEGMDKALQDLQGKLSPGSFMRLNDAATKAKQASAQMAEHLAKANKDSLEVALGQEEEMGAYAPQLLTVYDQVAQAKGAQVANEQYQAGMGALIQQLSGQKLPNGQPRYAPQVLEKFKSMSPDQFRSWYMGSGHRKELIGNRLKELQADFLAQGGPKSLDSFRGADGSALQADRRNGKFYRNGEPITGEQFAALNPQKIETKKAGEGVAAQNIDLDEKPLSDDESFIIKKYILDGKAPVFGRGAKADEARLRFWAGIPRVADSLGMGADQVVQLQKKVQAAQEGTKRLMTQNAQIKAGEENVQNVLNILEDETKKLGGIESPKIRGFQAKLMSEWGGQPDFIGYRQAYLDLRENLARIYSGVTGAGGTPVSFLELAKDALPENPSLAQVLKLRDIIPKLFTARRAAVEKEMDEISKTATLPAAKTPNTVSPTKPEAPGKAATPVIDSAKLDTYLSGMSSSKATLPERKEAAKAAKDLMNQIKSQGGEVPKLEPGVQKMLDDLTREDKKKDESGWRELAPGVRVRVKQ